MKTYTHIDKNGNILGISRVDDPNNTQSEFDNKLVKPVVMEAGFTGEVKKVEVTTKDIEEYNKKGYTEYELKDGKIVGKHGKEKIKRKSKIQILEDKIIKLENIIKQIKQ